MAVDYSMKDGEWSWLIAVDVIKLKVIIERHVVSWNTL